MSTFYGDRAFFFIIKYILDLVIMIFTFYAKEKFGKQ